jgi:membrane-associated phospholipid phosphatase
LVAIAILAVGYVAITIAMSAGMFVALDHEVALTMHGIWQESLHAVFQVIAELGGLEMTGVLMVGLFFYLWRSGFGSDSLAVLAFAGAVTLEILYKFLMFHPGPPRSLSHADGPSITDFLLGSGAGNSFPSGHMVRTVVVYGLLAFVVRRLAPSPVVRAMAVPVAVFIIVVVAFDRLYLNVHWESDVIGGLLLGAIGLLAGTVWLDRPRRADN